MSLERKINGSQGFLTRLANSTKSKLITLFAGLMLAGAGCNAQMVASNGDRDNQHCYTDNDCPTTEICVSNQCQDPNIQHCYTDNDCPTTEVCVSNQCQDYNNSNVNVQFATTNHEGKAYFQDKNSFSTPEEVVITAKNYSNQPVSNATVVFFDGPNFETFIAQHSNYTNSAANIFEHNSGHDLSLTTAPLQSIYHDQYTNERSQIGAENFFDWTKSDWDYLGCRTKDQTMTMMQGGTAIIKLLSKYVSLGIADNTIDKAQEWLSNQWPEGSVSHLWFNDPAGFSTSTIWTMDVKPLSAEICDNGIDDDCNGLIDNQDSFCQHGGGAYCSSCESDVDCLADWHCTGYPVGQGFAAKWCVPDSLCSSNEGCPGDYVCKENHECEPQIDRVCKNDAEVIFRDICGNDIVHDKFCEPNTVCENGLCKVVDECFGVNFECHNGDVWAIDNCGVRQSLIYDCNDQTEMCQDGECVERNTTGSYCHSCDTNLDCEDGWSCIRNDDPLQDFSRRLIFNVCAPENPCYSDSNCPGEYECDENVCRPITKQVCDGSSNITVYNPCMGEIDSFNKTCNSNETCQSGTCVDEQTCTPHGSVDCFNGDLWWYNSCGDREGIADDCNSNETCRNDACIPNQTCTSHDHRQCYGGDSYWYDSCGERETLVDDCTSNEICQYGECVTEQTCTSHVDLRCDEGHPYWFNSCGEKEEREDYCRNYEVCEDGACACVPNDHTQCVNGDSYWYSSCGEQESLADDCEYGLEICQNGVCVDLDCESHDNTQCFNGDPYWYNSCGYKEELSDVCSDDELCRDGECISPGCTSRYYSDCYQGDSYWYDSCGERGAIRDACSDSEQCIGGVCQDGCTSEITNGLDDDCDGSIDEHIVQTGDPQITLFWETWSDLDLHVVDPSGCSIYHDNRSCGDGYLDRDAYRACNNSGGPPENISWNENQVLSGRHEVKVNYFQDCDNNGPINFIVSVSLHGNVTTYERTINNPGDWVTITTFNY
jgi:hypothetical protein